jgi:predicted acylesterase/phospholipase RssA
MIDAPRPAWFRQIHYVCMTRLLLLLVVTISVGCGPFKVRTPVPYELSDVARVPGMPDTVRFWGDTGEEQLEASLVESLKQERVALGITNLNQRPPASSYLALSGGGADGAFGAGLLNGWTARGDRPTFKVVTGISTGALIAPFAFIGPDYDDELKAVYTTINSKDVFVMRGILAILRGDSIGDTAPLAKLAAKYIDMEVLRRVAEAHRAGRRLYVGTTNLDAQRPVVWDMGEIACVGTEEALDLFRTVLIASASIPGAFPPQYLDVTVGDADALAYQQSLQRSSDEEHVSPRTTYDEMHVDGGTTAQVFLAPLMLDLALLHDTAGGSRERTLYVVRNTRIAPEYSEVRPWVPDIGAKALMTVLKGQGVGNLYMLYVQAKRNRMKYQLAFVPDDVPIASMSNEAFDKDAMNKLYAIGYEMGRSGYPWLDSPPGMIRPTEYNPIDGLPDPATRPSATQPATVR